MNGAGPRIASLVFSNMAVLGRKGEWEEGETMGSGEGRRTIKGKKQFLLSRNLL